MKFLQVFFIVFTVFFGLVVSGCGDSDPEPKPQQEASGHVWKSQTDTIQHAKDAAAGLEQTLQERDQKINQ